MKDVQQQGGTRESQDVFIGLERQITIDTTNWDLRLHDGVTPGGYRVLNSDNADIRYQAANPELTGFSSFDATERGILVRLGPADYAFRTLTSETKNITLTNPAGQAGNPKIELAAIIDTEHEWLQTQLMRDGLIVVGGIEADLAGDTFGTHTGAVFGPVVGDTQGTHNGPSNGTHTGAAVGPVDARGATFQVDDGAILLSYLAPAIIAFIQAQTPIGVIVMWSGFIVDIPDGWALCDGTFGTPDLRNRFIVGAGDSYLEGDVGGSDAPTITGATDAAGSHSHSVSVTATAITEAQMPAHTHPNGVADDTNSFQRMFRGIIAVSPTLAGFAPIDNGGGSGPQIEGLTGEIGGGEGHTHAASTGSAGSHAHTFSIDSAPTLPPFYALAFIQKVS